MMMGEISLLVHNVSLHGLLESLFEIMRIVHFIHVSVDFFKKYFVDRAIVSMPHPQP